MRSLAILIALLALVLSGCNPAAGGPASPSATKPAASATATQAATTGPNVATATLPPQSTVAVKPSPSTGTPTSADATFVYERSGGIAGVREKWIVYPDGRIVAQNGTERRVTPAEVAAVAQALDSAGFFALSDSYGVGGSCRDCFTVTLTARSGAKQKTVTAVMEATETPAAVKEMVGRVDKLVRGG